MDVDALGDRAIRFVRPAGGSARALVDAIRRWPGVVDVVVAREDVGVYFDREPIVDLAAIAALGALGALAPPGDAAPAASPGAAPEGELHVLRVVYDGPDLDDVARATGLTREDVIARHAAGTYTVDTMGFAPGFAYLDGLDPALHLPRRATPRTRVPAGTLAIAGAQTAVYPFDSPGGWHLIGRVVDAQMFGESGPLLTLGDRVRFQP